MRAYVCVFFTARFKTILTLPFLKSPTGGYAVSPDTLSLYNIITLESVHREQNIITIGSPQKRTRLHVTNEFLTIDL